MSKDTIYREDAIKAISQWLDNEDDLFNIGLKQAVYEIKRVPSADTFEITKEALIEAIDNAETVGDVVESIAGIIWERGRSRR